MSQILFQFLTQDDLVSLKNQINSENINILFGYSLLHFACISKKKLPTFKLLIESGSLVNQFDGYSPLHFACWHKCDFECVKLLLDSGADPNIQNGQTPLHLSIIFQTQENVMKLLLSYGAKMDIKNGKIPIDLLRNKSIIPNLKSHISLFRDMEILFERKELTDYEIKKGKYIRGIHKLYVQFRIGKNIPFTKFINILLLRNEEDIERILYFIYTGKYEAKYFKELKTFFEEIGNKEYILKIGRNGILYDLKNLYEDEESKDFRIFVGDQFIPVHKLILLARSELFRGMFLSVNDKSNQVTDYSEKSLEAINAFVYFIYHDELPKNISNEIFKELDDAVIFYQLNEDSSLDLLIEENLKKNEK
ncbi:ankyrin repeat ph and sec7 domain containing protein secg-related [Anaeramoeba ignava]|uniref:Ankyrin repeat ph and sec7 domain containing protein secg-related n=1 Tax=Anaeramoeba ignava TaxID=1746090 RepID=A0A9Q0LTZ7_ANAIG|nr:ankyrin repeat ph and sec7 domain containing protein secg-related [Anaeramoeba ignava]